MDSWKRTLLELLTGIVLSGVVFEVIGLIFVKDKLAHSIGMLLGVIIALAMATHMAFSLNNALDWEEEHAKRSIWKSFTIRYVAVVAVMGIIAYFRIGNAVSCFCGIMALKAGAYLQPFVHKFCNKYIIKIEEGGYEDGSIEADADDDFGDE